MNREAIAYALAFVGVITAGIWFVLPRLRAPDAPKPPSPFEALDIGGEDRESSAASIPDAPVFSTTEVEVAAPQGALRGPLHPVFGADVESLSGPNAGLQRLRVTPREAFVSFGAVGHQWVHRAASSFKDGERITLPMAADPLIVRVRESDGTPAVGVPVRIRPEVPGIHFRTDDGGTLVLDHLAPGFVVLNFNTSERSGPVLRLRAGKDRDITVTLDPAWHVRGRLVDAEGAPIPDAHVSGFGPGGPLGAAAPSDEDGLFLWRGPAVARASLRVQARGWSPVRIEVAPPAVGVLTTDVGRVTPLGSSAALEGHVDAIVIEPHASVTVEPAVAALVREVFGLGHALDRPLEVPVAPDGTFAIGDIEPGIPLRVRVRGTGVAMDQIVVAEPGRGVSVRLFPPQGHTLHGQLADTDGTALEGVQLLVSSVQRDGDQVQDGDRSVVTGVDGRFRLLGLSERVAFVRAYVPGRRSLLQQVTLPAPDGFSFSLEAAKLDQTRRVHGTVINTEQQPVAGVTIRAAGISTRTDDKGAFVLDGVESLATRIDLFYGFEPGACPDDIDVATQTLAGTESVTPGGPALKLVLPYAGRVQFRVVDGVNDEPVSFVHVYAVSGHDGDIVVDRGFATRDGTIELPDLAGEGLSLSIFATDRRWSGTVAVKPGVLTDLGVLAMTRGVRVEGKVLDHDGTPVVGATVGVLDPSAQAGADPAYERERLFRRTTTDETGAYAIEGFGVRHGKLGRFAEAVDLAIWSPDRAPVSLRVKISDLEPGAAAVADDVKLETGAFLSLDLQESQPMDYSGPERPIHGAVVDAEFRDGSDFLDLLHWGMLGGPVASTDDWRRASTHLLFEARSEDGYLLGPLRPGPYELWVSHPKFKPFRQKLTVVHPDQVFLRHLGSGIDVPLGKTSHYRFEMSPLR